MFYTKAAPREKTCKDLLDSVSKHCGPVPAVFRNVVSLSGCLSPKEALDRLKVFNPDGPYDASFVEFQVVSQEPFTVYGCYLDCLHSNLADVEVYGNYDSCLPMCSFLLLRDRLG